MADPTDCTLKAFQVGITAWADRMFPDRTADEILRKMLIEVEELIEDRVTPDEYADVVILVLDLASQYGIDIETTTAGGSEIPPPEQCNT